jgi:hypothetical protein
MEKHMDKTTLEQNARVQMDQKQVLKSEHRSNYLNKLKEECGLDEETFNQITQSFESKDDEESETSIPARFSFRLKGSKVSGTVLGRDSSDSHIRDWVVDGVVVGYSDEIALEKKFKKIIMGLLSTKSDKDFVILEPLSPIVKKLVE